MNSPAYLLPTRFISFVECKRYSTGRLVLVPWPIDAVGAIIHSHAILVYEISFGLIYLTGFMWISSEGFNSNSYCSKCKNAFLIRKNRYVQCFHRDPSISCTVFHLIHSVCGSWITCSFSCMFKSNVITISPLNANTVS